LTGAWGNRKCPPVAHHTVLDTFQSETSRDLGETLDMPILHLPQVVGLALGMSARELGIDKHMVPVNLPIDGRAQVRRLERMTSASMWCAGRFPRSQRTNHPARS